MRYLSRNYRIRTLFSAFACVSAIGLSVSAAMAAEIQVWHALNEHNTQVFEKLVKQYNRSQSEHKVVLQEFLDEQALDEALAMVDGQQRPNLVQLPETTGLDDVATRSYIQPMYQLLANHHLEESTWFLPSENNFLHDRQGRLLALPWMAEV